jgi:hypothetical protein
MSISPRAACVALALAAASACGGRQVDVGSPPTPASTVSGTTAAAPQVVAVSNTLSQAVNVSVTASGSSELFLRQIPANTVERIPVQGVARGTMVTFKAVTVDGSRTYQSRSVALTGLFTWAVP